MGSISGAFSLRKLAILANIFFGATPDFIKSIIWLSIPGVDIKALDAKSLKYESDKYFVKVAASSAVAHFCN